VERLPGRGRSVGLRLTEQGREALITGSAAEEAAEQQFAEVLGPQLYEDVREILQEVRNRLIAEIARRASEPKSLSGTASPRS
jgi:DNA-binding MarR family transcriptional regulator